LVRDSASASTAAHDLAGLACLPECPSEVAAVAEIRLHFVGMKTNYYTPRLSTVFALKFKIDFHFAPLGRAGV
jgi:hypothetical protein